MKTNNTTNACITKRGYMDCEVCKNLHLLEYIW